MRLWLESKWIVLLPHVTQVLVEFDQIVNPPEPHYGEMLDIAQSLETQDNLIPDEYIMLYSLYSLSQGLTTQRHPVLRTHYS